MKKFLCSALLVLSVSVVNAQLKPKQTCGTFKVDILRGTVADASADFTIGQIKEKLPCATSEEEESKTAKCGGGVFYKDKDVYFFTQRNYIEIGPAFKGEFTFPVMNTKRGSLFTKLGNPLMKDTNWDAYQTRYGTLVLHYNAAGLVKKIHISSFSASELDLCEQD
jgi:hypothetical protein